MSDYYFISPHKTTYDHNEAVQKEEFEGGGRHGWVVGDDLLRGFTDHRFCL